MPDSQWYNETWIWPINNVENYVVFPTGKVFNSDNFSVVSEAKCATHFCRENTIKNKQKPGSKFHNWSQKNGVHGTVVNRAWHYINEGCDYPENNVIFMFAHYKK